MDKKKKAARKAVKPKTTPTVTTYTIRDIPTADWQEFKHKLDDRGHKVNWVFAELIRRVGNGEIALTK